MARILAVRNAASPEHLQHRLSHIKKRSASPATHLTAINNVRVFDGDTFLANKVVIIEEVQAHDGEGQRIIDGAGMTLLPGLIDAHVHLTNPNVDKEDTTPATIALLKHCAELGVTTVLDMGRMPGSHRDVVGKHEQDGVADLRFVGNFATCTGATHSKFLMSSDESIVDTVDQARNFVAGRVGEGVDYIKMVADVPGPTQEVLDTIAIESTKAKKLSVAHAAKKGAFDMAQKAGVDIITHVPMDEPINEAAALKMALEDRVSVPTLVMSSVLTKTPYNPSYTYEAAKESVSQLYRAGAPIVAGTDSNQSVVAPIYHGDDLFRELELLEEAGLSRLDVLRAATSLAAKHFRLDDRGVIKDGKRADLILVEGNPMDDPKAIQHAQKVWIAGKEVRLEKRT